MHTQTAGRLPGLLAVASAALGAGQPTGSQCPRHPSSNGAAVSLLPSPQHPDSVVLVNGWTCAVIALSGDGGGQATGPGIVELRGDINGDGNWGPNSLSVGGIRTEAVINGALHSASAAATATVLSPGGTAPSAVATVQVSGIAIAADVQVQETWTISLAVGRRNITLVFSGTAAPNGEASSAVPRGFVRHTFPAAASSLFGQFNRGVLQMMNKGSETMLVTNQTLQRWYALGGHLPHDPAYNATGPNARGSLDILPSTPAHFSHRLYSTAGQPRSHTTGVGEKGSAEERWMAVASGPYDGSGEWTAALFEVVAGGWAGTLDAWINSTEFTSGAAWGEITHRSTWTSSWLLAAGSDGDFPVGTLETGTNLPSDDLRALLTAIYASPAGQLISFYPETPGMSQTSLHTPSTGYGSLVNFFDPDNFLTVSALALSGDLYLINEARKVVETTGRHIRADGQIPRKIDSSQSPPRPIYDPYWGSGNAEWSPIMPINIHWVLAVLNVAKADPDLSWLRTMLPTVQSAVDFILGMIQGPPHTCYNAIWECPAPPPSCDPDDLKFGTGTGACGCKGGAPYIRGSGGTHLPFLLSTSGSLMNIPLRKGNFTSDTNLYAVHFLSELTEAYNALGLAAEAKEFAEIGGNISAAVNTHLWSPEGDHYITQLNHDGTTADYVDYSANAMAIFTGVAGPERATKIFARMAKGQCIGPGKRATWVSELPYYCPSKSGSTYGCQVPTTQHSGVVMSDSTSVEGRVGLMDARARVAVGGKEQLEYFNSVLLEPIKSDLLQYTWLTERYDCNGTRIRTPFFFEFPCLLTMMLREMRYGIQLGLSRWVVRPFGPTEFVYRIGNVAVTYNSNTAVSVSAPGSGPREVTVGGFPAGRKFTASACGQPVNPSQGVVGGDTTVTVAVKDVAGCLVQIVLH